MLRSFFFSLSILICTASINILTLSGLGLLMDLNLSRCSYNKTNFASIYLLSSLRCLPITIFIRATKNPPERVYREFGLTCYYVCIPGRSFKTYFKVEPFILYALFFVLASHRVSIAVEMVGCGGLIVMSI